MTNTTKFVKFSAVALMALAMINVIYCVLLEQVYDITIIGLASLVVCILAFFKIILISAIRAYFLPKYFKTIGRIVIPVILAYITSYPHVVISIIAMVTYANLSDREQQE
jgi:hypothetical protein